MSDAGNMVQSNECDGCRAGYPIRKALRPLSCGREFVALHYDGERLHMVCMAKQYKTTDRTTG